MSSTNTTSGRFRASSRTWFLTFAQCATTKEEALSRALAKETDLEWVVVGKEAHASGDPHLHLVLRYKAELHTRDQTRFNYIGGKQCNIVRPRNLRATLKYVTKGGDFVSDGLSVETFLNQSDKRKSTAYAVAATGMMNGQSIEDLLKDNPGFVMQNLRKIREFSAFLEEQEIAKRARSLGPFTLKITTELGVHEIKIGFPRKSGDEHYWIYGPTAVGKTTRVLDPIRNYGLGFALPYNNDFTGYSDSHQFLYADEYKGQLTSFTLNQLCDGGLVKLNTKGGSVIKKKNLTVVVISNFPVSEVYKDAVVVSTVERRFTELQLTSRFETEVIPHREEAQPASQSSFPSDASTQPWSQRPESD